MGRTNIPDDFDFLDADLNLKGLPVEELAELRRAEPIHWVDVPGGTGGFGDKGYWLVTKHADVKEVSRRSDVFLSSPDGAIPVWPQEMTRDAIDLQRSVLLNMDAPHHTRLRKIISRGFTPRAIGRLRDELNARAQNIVKTAASLQVGDFVERMLDSGSWAVLRRPRSGREVSPLTAWLVLFGLAGRVRLPTARRVRTAAGGPAGARASAAPAGLPALAARAATSPRTFLRRFEAAVGTSPLAWLQRERIGRARELLEGTALPLARVAEQCGYGSAETFRAAFRRIVGVPPTAGVGCSASARSSAVVEVSRSLPAIGVPRCQSASVRCSCGSWAICRSTHSGSSASRIVSITS